MKDFFRNMKERVQDGMDGAKNLVDALSDVDHVKATFKEFKQDVAEAYRESALPQEKNSIQGRCPFCGKHTTLRELSLAENLAGLGKFAAGEARQFVGVGLLGKLEAASKSPLFGDGRTFENHICTNCNGHVMSCAACKEIMPFAPTGEAHRCGTGTPALESTPAPPPPTDDLIAKLERLATLREKGFLTEAEFDQQKKKLIG